MRSVKCEVPSVKYVWELHNDDILDSDGKKSKVYL